LKISRDLLLNSTERKDRQTTFSIISLICAMGLFLFGKACVRGAENVTSLTADIMNEPQLNEKKEYGTKADNH
jgi:hypothetical protein